MPHTLTVVTVQFVVKGSRYRAACTCGWRGSLRAWLSRAQADATQHEDAVGELDDKDSTA